MKRRCIRGHFKTDMKPGMYICTVGRDITLNVMLLFFDGAVFVDNNGFWIKEKDVLTHEFMEDYIKKEMNNWGGAA